MGSWGEGLFIFRELGSTANYLRGAGEQANTFRDLGSTVKKLRKYKASILFEIALYIFPICEQFISNFSICAFKNIHGFSFLGTDHLIIWTEA